MLLSPQGGYIVNGLLCGSRGSLTVRLQIGLSLEGRPLSHVTDKKLINRLRRAHGHLATIITMIEANRDGLEIAQQMQAVVAALEKAKTVLITDHIEHHLEEVVGPLSDETRQKLAHLGDIAKLL